MRTCLAVEDYINDAHEGMIKSHKAFEVGLVLGQCSGGRAVCRRIVGRPGGTRGGVCGEGDGRGCGDLLVARS